MFFLIYFSTELRVLVHDIITNEQFNDDFNQLWSNTREEGTLPSFHDWQGCSQAMTLSFLNELLIRPDSSSTLGLVSFLRWLSTIYFDESLNHS